MEANVRNVHVDHTHRKSRKNTIQEKRRMRAERKKRKRSMKARKQDLRNAFETASKLKSDIDSKEKLLEKTLNKMHCIKICQEVIGKDGGGSYRRERNC